VSDLHKAPRRRRRRPRGAAPLCALAGLLSACAVGPDYERPQAPTLTRYTPEKTASPGRGQHFREGEDVPERWWEAFGSRRLDELVEEGLARSPTLEAADAAIRVAQFNAFAATGQFFPQVTLNSNSLYSESSGETTATQTFSQTPYGFFTKQVQISYTLDVWGANWRTIESLDAQRESQVYQKEAARLTLAANLVRAAIEEASLRGQIAATHQVIALQEQGLTLLQQQLSRGVAAGTAVLAQETALGQARLLLPNLESRLGQQRDLLTALAGRYPSDEVEETFTLAQLSVPRELPVSLPSRLLEQRPDIRAAEANLHAASAQIGVAVAARLPNITLSATGLTSAFSLTQLFYPGTFGYTLMGNVAQTAFDGMTLYNKQKAVEAAFDQAKAQYRDTGIKAFQNVADALRALQNDAKAVSAARSAEGAAKRYLDRIILQQHVGTVSQLEVVTAQVSYLEAANARVQTEAQRLTDTVALYVALGGGWGSKD